MSGKGKGRESGGGEKAKPGVVAEKKGEFAEFEKAERDI